MKYLFIYYTGTYNTRFLTQKIVGQLVKAGDTVDTVEIQRGTPLVYPRRYDMVGLGFPIYGFNSPLPFNQYLKKLDFAPRQRFFIYENSGESMAMNNAADRIPMKIMEEKGCECVGEYHFLMPYNIHFPFGEPLLSALMAENKKLLKVMEHHLQNGIFHGIKSNFWLDLGAFFVSVQKVGGNVNSLFYRVDTEKCLLCQQCVRTCPQHNISLKNGKITFGHRCDMCMRCSYYCPASAIHIGMLEKWRVTDYYDLEALWEKSTSDAPANLPKDVPFYKSYQRTFKEIDEAYARILHPDEEEGEAETAATGGI